MLVWVGGVAVWQIAGPIKPTKEIAATMNLMAGQYLIQRKIIPHDTAQVLSR